MDENNQIISREENNKKHLDISPLTKGRRMLVFLGDFFINFMISIFLMNLVVLPIAKATTNYEGRMKNLEIAEENRNDILYENEILFYENVTDKIDFNLSLNYTSSWYAKYFIFENNEKYEVIKTYFIDIKNDEDTYLKIYRDINKDFPFFEFVDNRPVLKENYKQDFAPIFDEKDTPTASAEQKYEQFIENVFLKAYSLVIEDIELNDLTSGEHSYKALQNNISNIEKYYDLLILICTFISYFVSSLICFLIYPLANQNGRTITMSIMKVDRVGINNIFLLKKIEVAIDAVYHTASNLLFIILVPVPTIYLAYAFNIGNSSLFILSMFSALIIIISFIFLMVSQYNQTLFDFLSRSLLIKSDDLDEIYRLKGYMDYDKR